MIIDHIGLTVGDYEVSKQFFCRALAPLGIELIAEVEGWAGLGKGGKPEFWFGAGGEKQRPLHIAFIADNRDQVRAFHAAALAAGEPTTVLREFGPYITQTISALLS
jgi:catechol 2,3-dioxygenase-like lactoylglutathione lyase family enzyme